MKIKPILYFLLPLFSLSGEIHAQKSDSDAVLQSKREKVISQYITDLKNADYHDISQLFEINGMVVSTSRGKMNAKDFFYAFLPNIASANTTLHHSFYNKDSNHYAVRFQFTFKLKSGETEAGEYIDEFIFKDRSTKLSVVYMFENLKFDNLMD